MRIITGTYKGRKLESPVGYDVRPTSDKVKESVFNLLMNDIWGSVCIDLFAGTGGLGLEALSRGAERCYFCDNSRESLELVKRNVRKCGAEQQSVILAGDYSRALPKIREKAGVIFLDPPYDSGIYEKCLRLIDSLDLLEREGIIVAEHDAGDLLPQEIGRLERVKERKYGRVKISIYQYAEEASE